KEVQKRWRSIRDSYTKAYRAGKCVPADQCAPGSRRYQHHKQMAFLLRALKNKSDKYESFSEVSNSPQHPPPEDIPKIKNEIIEKPLDLKTKREPEKPVTQDKCNQASIDKCNQVTIDKEQSSLEIKIDANSILPDDHFDDDKLFMNSLLPLFKKMDDDTRLLCRIEVLKIIRHAIKGNKCFEAIRMAEDSFFTDRLSGILAKEEAMEESSNNRSPSPLPMPTKRRGPGRPRKVRPPPSDSDEEQLSRKRGPRMKVPPLDVPRMSEMDESLSKATSVAQLSTPLFMKLLSIKWENQSLTEVAAAGVAASGAAEVEAAAVGASEGVAGVLTVAAGAAEEVSTNVVAVEDSEAEVVAADAVLPEAGAGASRAESKHGGVFIARGKEDALVTRNLVPGSEVYGEKRISVETDGEKVEYRVWNPFRSKLAAAIMGGVDAIHMPPGSRVLYLGAASGTTVSHVSDVVGPEGLVYAVEFSHRMLVGMVDTIFADVAQPDQARIVSLNAQHFLKNGGHFVISIKASCIDSTAQPEAVFAAEVKKLQADKLKPQEQLTLEPYERDHAVVVGVFRPPPKKDK
ncbi:hypothetical protein MSG28_015585, partial [Choristoneura fumiferana]